MNAYTHIRLTTFGPSRLELVCAEQTEVISLRRHEKLRGVLTLLLCASERTLPRAELARALYGHEQEGRKRLEDILNNRSISRVHPCLTREVFFAEIDRVRVSLPAQERFWWDADAFLALVEEATCCDEPQRALLLWQQAEALIGRGTFLSDDVAAPWREQRIVRRKQEKIDRARRQMLRGLGLSVLASGGEEKAEEYLCEYFQEAPNDFHTLELVLRMAVSHQRPDLAIMFYELVEDKVRTSKSPFPIPLSVRNCVQELQSNHCPSHSQQGVLPGVDAQRIHSEFLEIRTSSHDLSFPPVQAVPLTLITSNPALWFSFKLHAWERLISQAYGRADMYAELQQQLNKEFDMVKPRSQSTDTEYYFSRRQALLAIASLPLSWLSESGWNKKTTSSRLLGEEFLPCCAASLTACWHLLRGHEFALVQDIVASSLPFLHALATQSMKRYQPLAANLAIQAYRLLGILALHRNHPEEQEDAFRQAVWISRFADDVSLQVSALISLGYHKSSQEALPLYHRALHLERYENASALVQARLYAELAVAAAMQREEKMAHWYEEQAHKRYPQNPERDPSFLFAEFSLSSFSMELGRMYLVLGQHFPEQRYAQQAQEIFSEVEYTSSVGRSERIRVESLNYQAQVALTLKEKELFQHFLEKGIDGARLLGSQKRWAEIQTVYQQACRLWKQESWLKAYRVLLPSGE